MKALGGAPGASRAELAKLPKQFPELPNDVPGIEAALDEVDGKRVIKVSFPTSGPAEKNAYGLSEKLRALGWTVEQSSPPKIEGNLSKIDFSGYGWSGTARFQGSAGATKGLGAVDLRQE